MFNVGTPELLVILLVALIVLGPNRLPDAARQVGKFMGEFRRMSSGFQSELRDAMQEPVSSVKETLKGDPVPKATPASELKPVSQVIDTRLPGESPPVPPDESAAADPSSASLGGPAPDAAPLDVAPPDATATVERATPAPDAPEPGGAPVGDAAALRQDTQPPPTSQPAADRSAAPPVATPPVANRSVEAAPGADEHGGGDDEAVAPVGGADEAVAPVGGAGSDRSDADLT